MKTPWSTIGFSIAALVVALCAPARSTDGRVDPKIAEAVAATTTVITAEPHAELARALSALGRGDTAVLTKSRGVRCYYNCPPPIGSVTASPQVVNVASGALGVVTLHWRWEQSPTQAVTQDSCLWVSVGDESDAYIVHCDRPGRTYATKVSWIGAGNYVFRVAPGNPKGPYSKPVGGLFQLAQTIVIGVPQ